MLQAMNTGHDGSLCTIHANRPREALTRLENMVSMAGFAAAAARRAHADRRRRPHDRADQPHARRHPPRHRHHRDRRHGGRRHHDAGPVHLPIRGRAARRPAQGQLLVERACARISRRAPNISASTRRCSRRSNERAQRSRSCSWRRRHVRRRHVTCCSPSATTAAARSARAVGPPARAAPARRQLAPISSCGASPATRACSTGFVRRLTPQPELLRQRLRRTGRDIGLGAYGLACFVIAAVAGGAAADGRPVAAARAAGGLARGIVAAASRRRVPRPTAALKRFTNLLPEAIGLMVRSIKSGLPITESLPDHRPRDPRSRRRRIPPVVRPDPPRPAARPGAVGRPPTAVGVPEMKFLVVTLAVQRETGGNLAETLENLDTILRRRRQMRLKVKALSSEARASAMIIGSLPFIMIGVLSVADRRLSLGAVHRPSRQHAARRRRRQHDAWASSSWRRWCGSTYERNEPELRTSWRRADRRDSARALAILGRPRRAGDARRAGPRAAARRFDVGARAQPSAAARPSAPATDSRCASASPICAVRRSGTLRTMLARLKLLSGEEARSSGELLTNAGWRARDALTVFMALRLALPAGVRRRRHAVAADRRSDDGR